MSVSLAPGSVIDRYTVEALLGQGGMASVYAVRHNTLGSSHALKLLKVRDRGITERLVAEGKVQASLRHPNIVSVTDVIDVNGQPGLLMEQVDGPGLDAWLLDNRPPLADALKLFRGILAGVARAHRAGLVHRDLKPGNVLLDAADGLVIPKVSDFGLAKILDDGSGHSKTRSGHAMGTPQFMAPEQIRNAKDVDPRADIFALGCILYVLVCGALPFDDPDLLELYNKIATGRYTPPEQLVPGLPPHVRETIRACLQVNRDDRPEDCEALRCMLYGSDDTSLAGGVKLSGDNPVKPRPATLPPAAGATQDSWARPPALDPPRPPRAAPPPLQDRPLGLWRRLQGAPVLVLAFGLALPGIAVVAAATLLVVYLSGRDDDTSNVGVATPPAEAAPVEAAPVESAPGEVSPEEVAPTVEPRSAARPGEATRSDAPAPEATPAALPASSGLTGMVIVNSRPYSHVRIDGEPRGTTSFRGALPEGTHTAVLTPDSGPEKTLSITAVPNQTTVYCWDFALGAECPR